MNKDNYHKHPKTIPSCSLNKPRTIPVLPVNTCEVCGKHLTNRRAYAGHMLLAHQKRVGIMAELSQKIADMSRVRDAVYFLAVKAGCENDVLTLLNGSAQLKQDIKAKLE